MQQSLILQNRHRGQEHPFCACPAPEAVQGTLRLPKIARVTSVFELDTDTDGILDRYAEVNVVGGELQGKQAADVKLWELKHHETLTKQPGLTHLVRFSINTGGHPPIYQRAYSTPVTLRASIDTEIDWLLYKEFIRPSTSPWASPMVTVKKPDGSARLCVDFKAINLVTQEEPFYMPRVEEVLESLGKARYISKIDLSKGYYQIPMVEEDICKAAFTCHRGRFEFLRMPFGVKTPQQCFRSSCRAFLEMTFPFAVLTWTTLSSSAPHGRNTSST